MTPSARQEANFLARKWHFATLVFACREVFFGATADGVDASAAGVGNGVSALAGWFAGIGLIVLVILPIASLIWWSRKQDEINNMMAFCRRSLMFARHEADRVAAARALGAAKDPEALLVLLDVATDEETEANVRLAARHALEVMAKKYRRYQSVIEELLSAADNSELRTLIEILTANFERTGKGYVQSAYVIAREYFRLGDHEEARSWFRKANARNRKAAVYQGKIEPKIDACNERLVAEGDKQFVAGNYNEAKRLFAEASAGLDSRDKQELSPHLRMACVYCKLGNYEGADQATLQALRLQQETELSLTLNELVRRRLEKCGGSRNSAGECAVLDSAMDQYVAEVMGRLSAQLLSTR